MLFATLVFGGPWSAASVTLPSRRPLNSTQTFALERLGQILGLEDGGEEFELVRARFEELAASEAPYPVPLTALTNATGERSSSTAIDTLATQFATTSHRILQGEVRMRTELFRDLVRAGFVAGSTLGERQLLFGQAIAQNVGLGVVALMALTSRLLIDHGWSNQAWDDGLFASLLGLGALLAVNHRREVNADPYGPVFLLPWVRNASTRNMARLSVRQFWHRVRDQLLAADDTPAQLKTEISGVSEPETLAIKILTVLGARGENCTVWLED